MTTKPYAAELGTRGGQDSLIELRTHLDTCGRCLVAFTDSEHWTDGIKRCAEGGRLLEAWLSDRSLEGTRPGQAAS